VKQREVISEEDMEGGWFRRWKLGRRVDEKGREEMKGRLGILIQWCPSLLSWPWIAVLRHICKLEIVAHGEAVFTDRIHEWAHHSRRCHLGPFNYLTGLHQLPVELPRWPLHPPCRLIKEIMLLLFVFAPVKSALDNIQV
jgi:hypothetical protein